MTLGPKSLMEQGCFIQLCVSIYTVYKATSSAKIKITRPDLQVTKETRSKEVIRPEDNTHQKKEGCK